MTGRRAIALSIVTIALGIAVAELVLFNQAESNEPAASQTEKVNSASQLMADRQKDPVLPPPGAYVRQVILTRVSNASGLAAVQSGGRLAYATVDEVPEWQGRGQAPPLIVHSERSTGEMLGGQGKAGSFGEVEALAEREGRIVFPYKTGAQSVVLRDGTMDIPVVGPTLINTLRQKSEALAAPPFYFEFEGLAWQEKQWILLCAVVRPDAADTPKSTMANFLIRTRPDGTQPIVSAPIRWKDGRRYTDYGAALDMTEDGLAIVPGFHRRGVVLVNRDGLIEHSIDLPTSRVEGVRWFPETKTMWLVRECAGLGTSCADGVVFGTPLWDIHFRKGLFAK